MQHNAAGLRHGMAISLSVTVSMAADKSGMPKSMDLLCALSYRPRSTKLLNLPVRAKRHQSQGFRNICQILSLGVYLTTSCITIEASLGVCMPQNSVAFVLVFGP